MFEKIINFISEKFINKIIVLFFIVMSGSVFVQILFRYCFHKPIYWSEELPRVMLIWLTFLGAGVAAKRRTHLGITLLTSKLSPEKQVVLQLIANFLTMAFLLVLIYGGVVMTILTMPNRSAALQMPTGLVYLAVPVGGTMMFFHLFNQTIKLVKMLSKQGDRGAKI